MSKNLIAHRRKDGLEQPLIDHLAEVGEIAARLAAKIGVAGAGRLIGLLHDFGKFSEKFQKYIGSATGKINPDEDDYVDYKGLKGKIDHSSAGAQWVWLQCSQWGMQGQLVGQILSLCIASHHSGLIDCLEPDGTNKFSLRMDKPDEKTHKNECLDNAPQYYIEKLDALANKDMVQNVLAQLQKVGQVEDILPDKPIRYFNLGFLTRMLFSCLIDADRINSADFEYPENTQHRNDSAVDWSIPINRLELAIKEFCSEKPIDELRRNISNTCKQRAVDGQGIYTLTVPTGGGKTYASLRYALHHSKKYELDRIIYIIPFTSIIEQNAAAIREVIECSKDEYPWVLEQHSNLEPEQQNWHSKLVSENWDAPIVMTTMVQFLEVLFSGGTRGARKMHQLANSVLIFDEIQTLPINCTHLFCNALNFLTNFCNTTAVLCTATQPLLDRLKSPEKGQLIIPEGNELVSDVPKLFEDLERVQLSNKVRPEGWTAEQIAELALYEFNQFGSCLIIVNTKSWAQQLYQTLQSDFEENKDAIFQLSTSLCPAHRKAILANVRQRLEKNQPVLCVSTQLIEAGVDVDFASVIRFLAGLDSIAQAAGRCNRNGLRKTATVHVVNPHEEKIDLLKDIKVGRDKALRVLSEGYDNFLAPDAMQQYFNYYFYDRADDMSYSVSSKLLGRNDNLLNLLSSNTRNVGRKKSTLLLQQSFMTAGKAFKAIDSPTQAVIVPYGEKGKNLIAELGRVAKEFDVKTYRKLLKQAQKYSVNVFPNVWKRLQEEKAVHEIQPGEGIYWLDKQYYSDKFGLSDKPCNSMELNLY
ncbi:CRISPR-associated helicase Cas3 [hydrothermal vent metagenome]|uniref:CRISPR-associated helicase Cas3 n=1 Tax=hydrothermal vent metagenome TaxID=652676 RepID=A0A3B0YD21_9ZZZZ